MKFRWLLLGLTSLAIGQVGWWSYLLITKQNQLAQLHIGQLSSGVHADSSSSEAASALKIDATKIADRFRFMILSEGLFFCLVLSLGMIYAYRAHLQRLNLQKAHSDFLSSVTHELKTPIANIQLSLDSLDRIGATKFEGASKYFDRAQRACDRLLSQVDRVLSLASDDEAPLVIEAVSWSSIQDSLRSQFEPQAAKIHWPSESTTFKGSQEGVRLVLGCLIDNALKYATPEKTDSAITVALEQSADWVLVHVADQGQGLSKEELERIFDPFWRGGHASNPTVAKGTGLGLALSQRMAKRMGGDLVASTAEQGHGLKFTLKLPRVIA